MWSSIDPTPSPLLSPASSTEVATFLWCTATTKWASCRFGWDCGSGSLREENYTRGKTRGELREGNHDPATTTPRQRPREANNESRGRSPCHGVGAAVPFLRSRRCAPVGTLPSFPSRRSPSVVNPNRSPAGAPVVYRPSRRRTYRWTASMRGCATSPMCRTRRSFESDRRSSHLM